MKAKYLPTIKRYTFENPDVIFDVQDRLPELQYFWKTGENEVTFVLPPEPDKVQHFFDIIEEIGGFTPAQ